MMQQVHAAYGFTPDSPLLMFGPPPGSLFEQLDALDVGTLNARRPGSDNVQPAPRAWYFLHRSKLCYVFATERGAAHVCVGSESEPQRSLKTLSLAMLHLFSLVSETGDMDSFWLLHNFF